MVIISETAHAHAFGRHQAADVIRAQCAVGGTVVLEAVVALDPVGGIARPGNGLADFFGQFGRNTLVGIQKQNPRAAGLLDGKGLLAAPVAVHAALDDARAQVCSQARGVVGAEIVDHHHFFGKSAAFDAVFDIVLFVFGQNQYADGRRLHKVAFTGWGRISVFAVGSQRSRGGRFCFWPPDCC